MKQEFVQLDKANNIIRGNYRMNKIEINVKKLNKNAIVPKYQTVGAAGFDFHCIEDIAIKPKQTMLVKTGLAMAIPQGYELQVRPRSGMSLKTKMRVSNSPGTIDCDYRGEIGIIVDNIGEETIKLKQFDRIAQGVLSQVPQADFNMVTELDDTARGEGGFGSTNKQ